MISVLFAIICNAICGTTRFQSCIFPILIATEQRKRLLCLISAALVWSTWQMRWLSPIKYIGANSDGLGNNERANLIITPSNNYSLFESILSAMLHMGSKARVLLRLSNPNLISMQNRWWKKSRACPIFRNRRNQNQTRPWGKITQKALLANSMRKTPKRSASKDKTCDCTRHDFLCVSVARLHCD